MKQGRGNAKLQEPRSGRTLSTRESILLLQSSKLNGSIYPPWTFEPDALDFVEQPSFQDDMTFTLPEALKHDFKGWQRSNSIDQHVEVHRPRVPGSEEFDQCADLVQDITTDCSVVASLTAMTRPPPELYTLWAHVFHPWDYEKQEPTLSYSGKYVFRLYFNGCYRKVIIDDRLPMSKTDRKMYVIDRNSPGNMWPALLEKAYLKVRGGYDFPGSDSGTDLWILTGWIPEQCFLQSNDFDRPDLWQKIIKAYQYGDVLVTLGTGKMSVQEEKSLGLTSEHDYVVIDIKESSGRHLLKIKNPWSNCPFHDTTGKAARDINWRLSSLRLVPQGGQGDSSASEHSPGVFWVDLEQLSQGFESIYLNWNPGLFNHRNDTHFTWDLKVYKSTNGCFRFNPQYAVQSDQGGIVWLLLGRHFSSEDMKISTSRSGLAGLRGGFISLYAFQNGGNRVCSSTGLLKNSAYVDSPHTLLKLDLSKNDIITIALSEQSLPRTQQLFTLSALSISPCTLSPATEIYKHSRTEEGAWTKSSAGGNSSTPLYCSNPQYSVRFEQDADVCILLETPLTAVSVHAALFWSGGKLIHTASTRDLVGDTGEYSKGFACIEIANVPAGEYTIICSTFERAQNGTFSLHVSSTTLCEIRKLQASGAGKFIVEPKSAKFIPGSTKVRLALSSYRLNRISVAACPRKYETHMIGRIRTPLRVAVVAGKGPFAEILAISNNGEFMDTTSESICVQEVGIDPRVCTTVGTSIILERLATIGSEAEESAEMEINSEEPLIVGEWVAEE